MVEQFSWLWLATIAQLWRRTTLLWLPLTVFTRRMLVWAFAGVPLSMMIAVDVYKGYLKGVPMGLLYAPGVTLFTVLFITFGQAMWRFVAIPFTAFPGILGFPGLVLLKLTDFAWRIEAGPELGAEQSAASDQGIVRAKLDKARGDFERAVLNGEAQLTIQTVQVDGAFYGSPRLQGGKVLATKDGREEAVATVRRMGERFDIVDGKNAAVVTFDLRGVDKSGHVIAHPLGTTPEQWSEAAGLDVPVATTGGGAAAGVPILVSVGVAVVSAISLFLVFTVG